jgi:DNA-binding transcriptional regulator LsrR (DeoR family)
LGIETIEVVEFFPNELVAAMRSKYGGDVQAYHFNITPVNGDLNEEEKEEILQSNGIRDLYNEAKNADIFLLAIGTYKYITSRADTIMRYYKANINKLNQNASGHINFQPFNSERVLRDEFKGIRNIIAVPLEYLKQMSRTPGKHVIAVAAGEEKTEAVRASLSPNVRCYDILITDELIAQRVLNM